MLVYNCTGFGIEDQNLLCHLLRLTTCEYHSLRLYYHLNHHHYQVFQLLQEQ